MLHAGIASNVALSWIAFYRRRPQNNQERTLIRVGNKQLMLPVHRKIYAFIYDFFIQHHDDIIHGIRDHGYARQASRKGC